MATFLKLSPQSILAFNNNSIFLRSKTKDDIKLSLFGLWFRINDKVERIKTLLMRGGDSAVEGEPVTDSFSDISNYGVMAQVVARGKWAK